MASLATKPQQCALISDRVVLTIDSKYADFNAAYFDKFLIAVGEFRVGLNFD